MTGDDVQRAIDFVFSEGPLPLIISVVLFVVLWRVVVGRGAAGDGGSSDVSGDGGE